MEQHRKTGSENLDNLFTKLVRHYNDWDGATAEQRKEAETDAAFYDGDQWDEEEAENLREDGQPVLVFNHVAPPVNYMLGDEIRKRVDPKVFPRTTKHDDAANAATDKLKQIDDEEGFDDIRSEVFEDMLKYGLSGAVVEVEEEPEETVIARREIVREDAAAQETISEVVRRYQTRLRHVSYDRLFWDHHSRRHDFSDAKFLGIVTWMDKEDAYEFYPGAEEIVDSTILSESTNGSGTHDDTPEGWSDNDRERVKVVEIYWRVGVNWRVAHITGGGFLRQPELTGYRNKKGHNVCPLIMLSCFVTRKKERVGVIRGWRDPQMEINKTRSKAMHRKNTTRVVVEKGAVAEPDTAKQEIARPDSWIEINPGFFDKFRMDSPVALTQLEIAMLQEAKSEIKQTSIIGDMETSLNASGLARKVQQRAATVGMEKVFDRLRNWTVRMYRAMWERTRQFCTEEQWLRVTDDSQKAGYRFVYVNRPMRRAERLAELLEKGVPMESAFTMLGNVDVAPVYASILQQMAAQVQATGQQVPPQAIQTQALQALMGAPVMQEVIVANRLDSLDADIIIEEAPDTTTLQQEEFEKLAALANTAIASQLPGKQFVEMLIQASSLRSKKQLLEMLREPPTQQQQEAVMLQAAGARAEVEKTQADAMRSKADAALKMSEAQMAPVKAQKDQAQAVNDIANAQEAQMRMGRASVPEIPQ